MNNSDFLTIKEEAKTEINIKKSRFIGYVTSVQNETEAKEYIASLWKKYSDATHICYAYVLDDEITRSSDDREPSGTAGVPILETIKSHKLSNVIVAVVRYFGGIELGTSGLFKAYSSTASEVINSAKICKMTMCELYKLEFEYEKYSKFENFANNNNIKIIEKEFGLNITTIVAIKSSDIDKIKDSAKNMFGENIFNNFIESNYIEF